MSQEQITELKNILKTAYLKIKEFEPKKRPLETPKKENEEDNDDEDWVCAGRVWSDPPQPCIDGPRSNIKMGIIVDKKRITVCKECKLQRAKEKRAAKKQKVKEENE